MQLKTVPEDFIVVEEASHALQEQGPYFLVELTKRNMSTERALDALGTYLDIPRRFLGYAGAKDARAITRQHITIKAERPGTEERLRKLSRDSMKVRVLGYVRDPLSLGMLSGNRFDIVCRKLAPLETLHPLAQVPNYFDEQRFSRNNADIGRHLLRGEYLEAATLIRDTDREASDRLAEHLEASPNDAIGALRLMPKNILLMYVHAYQSLLFNEALRRYIRHHDPQAAEIPGPIPLTLQTKDVPGTIIPLVGFASDLAPPFDEWYAELLEHDGLAQRDFVNRALPFLTLEGSDREAFFTLRDLEVGPREPDEIHPGFEKQRLSFRLPKAAYATLAVKCLFRTGNVQ